MHVVGCTLSFVTCLALAIEFYSPVTLIAFKNCHWTWNMQVYLLISLICCMYSKWKSLTMDVTDMQS